MRYMKDYKSMIDIQEKDTPMSGCEEVDQIVRNFSYAWHFHFEFDNLTEAMAMYDQATKDEKRIIFQSFLHRIAILIGTH